MAASILESITDAFFCLNREWEFTYINRRAKQLLGRQRNDLLGKNIWALYPQLAGSEFEELYRKADREQASAHPLLTIRTMTDGMKSIPIRQKKGLRSISGMRPNASGTMNNY